MKKARPKLAVPHGIVLVLLALILLPFGRIHSRDESEKAISSGMKDAIESIRNAGSDKEAVDAYTLALKTTESLESKFTQSANRLIEEAMGKYYGEKAKAIRLIGETKSAVEKQHELKTILVQKAVDHYTQAIELYPDESSRITIDIAQLYEEFGDAARNQSHFGDAIGSKTSSSIKGISIAEKYYSKALLHYRSAYIQANIDNKKIYRRIAGVGYAKMSYFNAQLIEEIGIELSQAPIPSRISYSEKKEYQDVLHTKLNESQKAALKIYKKGLNDMIENGIDINTNHYAQLMLMRILELDPESEWKEYETEVARASDQEYQNQTSGINRQNFKGKLKIARSTGIVAGGKLHGERSRRNIMKTVVKNLSSLRKIYNENLKINPEFTGKVAVKFSIDENGSVLTSLVLNSTTGNSDFDNTIREKIKEWQFDADVPAGDITEVVYPFVFSR